MAQALTDDELLSAIAAAEETALGTIQGEIASDRTDATDRYLGKAYGNELPGRSSVVSRDVADVVEGVAANVLKPFVSGDRVVQFNPRGPEDEQAAQQETDYVNFIVLERNNGFLVLNTAVKDALLLRNGYVKLGWKKREDIVIETYQALSDDELAMLMKDEDVEVVQHSEYPDPTPLLMAPPPMPGPMPGNAPGMAPGPAPMAPPAPPSLHDVKVRRKQPTEYVELLPTPPDEVLVSQRTRTPSVQDADFVQHRTRVTISQVREMGYDVDDYISDDDRGQSLEEISRQRFASLQGDLYDDNTQEPSRRLVLFKETWIRIDRDGDGIAELRRCCSIGDTLLADEEADLVPIACGTGVLMGHQHLGISVYDLVQDIAQLKTALLRQFMDNKYLANNIQWLIDEDRVNVDDFMQSRPGGLKRTTGDPTTAAIPVQTPDTGPSALQALEYLDTVRENRTGFTRQTQGLGSDALSTETVGGAVMQLNQSQLRLEMMARTIAETLLRDLFRLVHALTLKHSTQAEKIQLRGKWVPVNPREWVRRTDMSIALGLGAGTPEQQFQKLITLAPFMQQFQMAGLVGPQEAYNYAEELWKCAGYKLSDRFVHEPQRDPQTGQPVAPPPQPSPQEKVAMINQQGDQAKLQAQMQLESQKMQMDAAAKQQDQQNALALQASNDARDAQREQLNHEREMQRMALDNKFKYDQMAAQFAFDAEQKNLDRQAQMQIEAHKANVASQNEQLKANTTKEIAAVPHQQKSEHHAQLLALLKSPKRVVRQPDGSFVVQHTTH